MTTVLSNGTMSVDNVYAQYGGGILIPTLEQEAVLVVNTLNGLVSIYATDKHDVGNRGGTFTLLEK
ncbi:unnamed protein product, partial [Rotaria socialis]